jgi:hypothetical protein
VIEYVTVGCPECSARLDVDPQPARVTRFDERKVVVRWKTSVIEHVCIRTRGTQNVIAKDGSL